jgi:hypothetical protein
MAGTLGKKIFVLFFSLFAGMTFLYPQEANDQYGFGGRTFLIQSALEVGKSTKGIWDVPGKPGKDSGNFKPIGKGDWLHMGVWEREKGDPDDRLFIFRPAQGSAVGRYFINFARNSYWGINAIVPTGKVEARTRADHFELKYLRDGRWKIYYSPGVIIALENNASKNGSRLVLRPDFNGPAAEWVFFDLGTQRSFIPVIQNTAQDNAAPVRKLEDVLEVNYPARHQYFNSVKSDQFAQDNSGGKMVSILNSFKMADQWTVVKDVISKVKPNSDLNAKRAILAELLKVDIKKGSNFLEKALSNKMRESIEKEALTEKDEVSKKMILDIANKI